MSKDLRPRIVSYYRVSTARQGVSGLGLTAQAVAVEQYRIANNAVEIASYQEIESGKNSDRPELAKAISHCKMARAVLVVAKLDRLARNVRFLSSLMESGVPFVACDNPHATPLLTHILAAVAEAEAKAISQRTIVALAVAKSKGVKLGSSREGHWDGREALRQQGSIKGALESAKVRSSAAQKARENLIPIVESFQSQNLNHSQIADLLNQQGYVTRYGKPWTRFTILKLLKGHN